ncbi:MAG TPA: class I SAM-dependent methyltransferase, partial [Candidatus Saccharimonadia bacterium]|nr:class I SAM-dependent methyltransferase [Candidatus Saccharimonadia bacterium]
MPLPQPTLDETEHSQRLCALIREEIAANGPIDFARYMALALYAPGLGYYSAGKARFGAAGDFVTAPELGGLYAATIARAVAPVLRETHGDFVELGAGSG